MHPRRHGATPAGLGSYYYYYYTTTITTITITNIISESHLLRALVSDAPITGVDRCVH